jgi:DNA invertase Pin-like site-specific DNA recombinase
MPALAGLGVRRPMLGTADILFFGVDNVTPPEARTMETLGLAKIALSEVKAERHRIVKRANDGRKAARARGVHLGRRPKLSDHQQEQARKRLANGDSCRSIAKDFNVHHATISRLA